MGVIKPITNENNSGGETGVLRHYLDELVTNLAGLQNQIKILEEKIQLVVPDIEQSEHLIINCVSDELTYNSSAYYVTINPSMSRDPIELNGSCEGPPVRATMMAIYSALHAVVYLPEASSKGLEIHVNDKDLATALNQGNGTWFKCWTGDMKEKFDSLYEAIQVSPFVKAVYKDKNETFKMRQAEIKLQAIIKDYQEMKKEAETIKDTGETDERRTMAE